MRTKSKSILASRRKLVRGVFAVPAVVTLTSGSPAAATSFTCFQRQFRRNDLIQPNDGVGAGDLLRIAYYKRTSNSRFFIKGSDLKAVADVTGGMVGGGLVSSTGFQRVNTAKTGLDTHTLASDPGLEHAASGYLVIRFDEHGNIVGVGAGSTGTAITGSCWVSAFPH